MERRRLPLFPLPVVLFPGASMPLHIFERRYREMVARCLETDRPFGLLHHDWDESGPFLNETGRVGTVARIRRFRPLEDGRSLILAGGEDRFSIAEEVEAGNPYFEAVVEPYEDRPPEDHGALIERRRRSLSLFRAVVEASPDADELPGWGPEEELSFRLAETVKIESAWQQSLLELRDEARRLERLDVIFRAALALAGEERQRHES